MAAYIVQSEDVSSDFGSWEQAMHFALSKCEGKIYLSASYIEEVNGKVFQCYDFFKSRADSKKSDVRPVGRLMRDEKEQDKLFRELVELTERASQTRQVRQDIDDAIADFLSGKITRSRLIVELRSAIDYLESICKV